MTELATDTRREALATYVSNSVKHGWRVETQTEYSATLVKGNRTNNVLHLILSLVTLGLWIPVWILIAVIGGEKRMAVRVDENGKINKS